jgi:hypothetical protein
MVDPFGVMPSLAYEDWQRGQMKAEMKADLSIDWID